MIADRWHEAMRAFDEGDAPIELFVRDDDGGWSDDRLFALLDVADAAEVPIDLALIPLALGERTAVALGRRFDAAAGRLGLHQHGYAHLNHEPAAPGAGGRPARKCEFGERRDLAACHRDLVDGRIRLSELFGTRLDLIFTPPWNRCGPALPGLLQRLGFAALSRDAGAPVQQRLPELSVHIDWSRHWRAAAAAGADPHAGITGQLRHWLRRAAPDDAAAPAPAAHRSPIRLGLMLHHAVMEQAELAALRGLLMALARHPRVRCLSMRECLALGRAALPRVRPASLLEAS